MKSDFDQIRNKDPIGNDVENQLLGKRHNYGDTTQPDLSKIARAIGFSAEEISQLMRLYQEKSKGIKGDCER